MDSHGSRTDQSADYRRFLSNTMGKPNPWEYALLSFSIAAFLGVVLLGLWVLYAHCKSRPPKFIKGHRPSKDQGIPANETGSMSACSDVTTRDLLATGGVDGILTQRKNGIARIDESDEDHDELQSLPDFCSARGGLSIEDDDSVGIWDYSVRSYAETTLGGVSASEYANTSHANARSLSLGFAQQSSSVVLSTESNMTHNVEGETRTTVSSDDKSVSSPTATTPTMTPYKVRGDSHMNHDQGEKASLNV